MTTPTKPRKFLLFARGKYHEVECAGTIRDAIRAFEAENGVRVHAGQSVDDGTPRFDEAAELEEFMRSHRGVA